MNFINCFLNEIKHTLHSVFLKVVEQGVMFDSARRGTIVLMEKLNKNPLKIAHWRPLSMLCSDYKIYAKIVANRLQYVLPDLIAPEQVGFMKGRQITQNLTELLTTIEYCKQNKIQAMIISIDFEKAFDTVNWNAMKKVLIKFGFSTVFINMIMVCYQGFIVNVGNNGYFTQDLEIKRVTNRDVRYLPSTLC